MSMSIEVIGLISDNNDLYKKHSKVLRACIDAEVQLLPTETADYFGSKYPEEHLFIEKLTVQIPKYKIEEDMVEGYTIKVSEIPEGVEIIRFANHY